MSGGDGRLTPLRCVELEGKCRGVPVAVEADGVCSRAILALVSGRWRECYLVGLGARAKRL
jgi:hypothetical protein